MPRVKTFMRADGPGIVFCLHAADDDATPTFFAPTRRGHHLTSTIRLTFSPSRRRRRGGVRRRSPVAVAECRCAPRSATDKSPRRVDALQVRARYSTDVERCRGSREHAHCMHRLPVLVRVTKQDGLMIHDDKLAREVPSHAGIMRGESGFTDTAQEPRPIPLNWCWWNGLSPSRLPTARS